MKYIRTKDRIVEIKKMTLDDKLTGDYIHERTADTIEELCDGVFVEDKNNPNVWFLMELDEFAKEKKEDNHLKEWNYLGFIKTDKGLIYVAKMNDKGEFIL